MKKAFVISIIFSTILSCSDSNNNEIAGNYIKFSINGRVFQKMGKITYILMDYEDCVRHKYTWREPVEITDNNFNLNNLDAFLMSLSIPGYVQDLDDTLIGKTFPIVLDDGHISKSPFELNINLYIDNTRYLIVVDNGGHRFYNRLTNIRYIGPYFESTTKDVYEIEGEFKVCFYDQMRVPHDSIFVDDGSYRVLLVVFDENYKK